MVVDSSIRVILFGLRSKKRLALAAPFSVLSASMFITKTCSAFESPRIATFLISSVYFLVQFGCQRTILYSMPSGRWVGNSPLTQLSNTPLGARTKAVSISPLRYRAPMVSMAILLLPVPISANKA